MGEHGEARAHGRGSLTVRSRAHRRSPRTQRGIGQTVARLLLSRRFELLPLPLRAFFFLLRRAVYTCLPAPQSSTSTVAERELEQRRPLIFLTNVALRVKALDGSLGIGFSDCLVVLLVVQIFFVENFFF